jgi:hypothetical protein
MAKLLPRVPPAKAREILAILEKCVAAGLLTELDVTQISRPDCDFSVQFEFVVPASLSRAPEVLEIVNDFQRAIVG